MNSKKIFGILAVIALMSLTSSCGLFKKYKDTQTAPEDFLGKDSIVLAFTQDSTSIGDIQWRDYFTDPLLRDLIDTALVRNTDLKRARLSLQQAEHTLKAAKLNFIPGFSFVPEIAYTGSASYKLPIQMDWSTNGIGSLTNRKREAKALALQAADNEQYIRSILVATVAKAYYQLQLLDKQLLILNETEHIWSDVLQTQKALMENGKAYSTSVNQMEASLMDVKVKKINAMEELRNTEYAICLLLAQSPHPIKRDVWGSFLLARKLNAGLPVQLLSKRPDVRAAERSVEAAYYVNKQALAAMFPSISISAFVGGGELIGDPIALIYRVLGSLSQPIFARGQLKSRYEITKLGQQQAADEYAQVMLNAGNEVNTFLRECIAAVEKDKLYKHQVEVLNNAFHSTIELMYNGKASYVEVLMAEDSLLKAEINDIDNMFSGRESLINLYIALGGGVE